MHPQFPSPIFLPDPLERHQLNEGLVSWWLVLPGLDGGRQWFDLCRQNHGTLTNMTTSASGWRGTTRPGGWGAVNLPAAGTAYVNCGDDAAFTRPTGFTLSCWFNLSSQRHCFLFNKDAPGDREYSFAIYDDFKLYGFVIDNTAGGFVGRFQSASSALAANRWYHGAMTYDGGTTSASVKLYTDGVQTDLSDYQSGSFTQLRDTSTQLGLGKYWHGSGYNFQGDFDDFRIYSHALSAAEVFSLYDASRTGYPGVLRRMYLPTVAISAWLTSTSRLPKPNMGITL